MNINSNKPLENQGPNRTTQSVPKATGGETKDSVVQARKVESADTVNISSQSKEIADIMSSVNQLPDVREQKVQDIKQRVDAGTYTIDPRKIADKLLSEL